MQVHLDSFLITHYCQFTFLSISLIFLCIYVIFASMLPNYSLEHKCHHCFVQCYKFLYKFLCFSNICCTIILKSLNIAFVVIFRVFHDSKFSFPFYEMKRNTMITPCFEVFCFKFPM